MAGRWSATHPWIAIAAWIVSVAALLAVGHLVGTAQLPNSETSSGQALQAQQMMSRDFTLRANEFVLFDSRSLPIGAPAYRAAIRDVLTRIEATGRVTQIRSPLDPRFTNQISASRHAALLQFQITGNVGDAVGRGVMTCLGILLRRLPDPVRLTGSPDRLAWSGSRRTRRPAGINPRPGILHVPLDRARDGLGLLGHSFEHVA